MDTLRSQVERAARGDQGATLHLSYTRGHELSGVTNLEIDAHGAYSLSSNVTSGRRPITRSGKLGAAQSARIFQALRDGGLLERESATRRPDDDEVPVIVVLSSGAASHRAQVWERDADADPGLHSFELVLFEQIRALTEGAVFSPW